MWLQKHENSSSVPKITQLKTEDRKQSLGSGKAHRAGEKGRGYGYFLAPEEGKNIFLYFV